MSIKIMQEVWEYARVSSGTLLVLLAIADSADERSRTCFPGIENLAHKARLSERQVKRVLTELSGLGIIHIDRNASPFKTNLYRISEPSYWNGGDNMSPIPMGRPCHPEGDAHVPSDGTPMSPKPSVTSVEPSESPKVPKDDLFSETCERAVTQKRSEIERAKNLEAFDRFWKAYPPCKRKTDEPKALEAFLRIVTGRHKLIPKTDPDTIIAGIEPYIAANPDLDYMPLPTSWLNGKRWNVENGNGARRRPFAAPDWERVER